MDTKTIRKQYMHLMPTLNKVLSYVNDKLSDLPPSEFELEANLKPYASVKRKALDEDTNEVSELSDLVRGRLFFSEQFNFEDVLNMLKQIFTNNINNIDKKIHKHEDHGLEYHGVIHMDLKIDGVNFELQIMPIEFKPYKEFLHQIYEQFRNNKNYDKLTDKQKDLLRKIHNEIYKKLDKQALSNRLSD